MRQNLKRATGAVATAANLLALSAADPVAAGQTRGSLSVTVRVVAACGGSVGTGGTTQQSEGCAPGSAPIAVVSEAGPPPVASTTQASAEVEGSGEIRYLTLIY
jgi:hypothetical protein